MEKNQELQPIDLSFDDTPDEGVKIYELNAHAPLTAALPTTRPLAPAPAPDEALTLGAEIIPSAKPVISGVFDLRLEDDDEPIDLTIHHEEPKQSLHLHEDLQQQVPINAHELSAEVVIEKKPTSDDVQPTKEPESHSNISQQREAPVFAQPEKVKRVKPKDPVTKIILLCTGAIGLLIIALNIIIFRPTFKYSEETETSAPQQEAAPKNAPVEQQTEHKSSKAIITGSSQSESLRTLSYEGIFDTANQQLSLKVIITSPKPAPLTFEQIGRNELPPVWIKKVEFDKKVLSFKDTSEVKLDVPLRIYYEDQKDRSRIMTNGSMTVKKVNNTFEISAFVPADGTIITQPITISGVSDIPTAD